MTDEQNNEPSFTFEWTYGHDLSITHERTTVEAPHIWGAWRRLASQIMRMQEDETRIPIGVTLHDSTEAEPQTRTKREPEPTIVAYCDADDLSGRVLTGESAPEGSFVLASGPRTAVLNALRFTTDKRSGDLQFIPTGGEPMDPAQALRLKVWYRDYVLPPAIRNERGRK